MCVCVLEGGEWITQPGYWIIYIKLNTAGQRVKMICLGSFSPETRASQSVVKLSEKCKLCSPAFSRTLDLQQFGNNRYLLSVTCYKSKFTWERQFLLSWIRNSVPHQKPQYVVFYDYSLHWIVQTTLDYNFCFNLVPTSNCFPGLSRSGKWGEERRGRPPSWP